MTSKARLSAHNQGECDPLTCPLCEVERLADLTICDSCDESTDAEACEHGATRCDQCGACKDCAIEARRP